MHKNSQKRFHDENYTYFITTKTFQNFPYFKEEILCELFIKELESCKKLKNFEIYAFALNHDHFHLMIKPNKEENISKIMQFLKRHFSRNANLILNTTEGDIRECRLQKHNDLHLKSTISEHDKFLKNLKQKFIEKYGTNQIHIPKFKWQKSFHDHVIRNPKDFEKHYNYTIYNYIKHELPKTWKYTSLNYPEMIDMT